MRLYLKAAPFRRVAASSNEGVEPDVVKLTRRFAVSPVARAAHAGRSAY